MPALTANQSDLDQHVTNDGFAGIPDVLTAGEIDAFLAAMAAEEPPAAAAVSQRGVSVYARRNLLSESPAVRGLACSAAIRRILEPFLGNDCFAVCAILFDKVPGANWNLTWHQDLAIAVAERREIPGWGPWSIKAGILHVQPPAAVLERMLTIRLHLDDCGPDNGPLRVLPGSHTLGRLDAAQIAAVRAATPEVACVLPRGGALLMRPLLLHASSAAVAPAHRRVLHVEFAAADTLPHHLITWKDKVGEVLQ